MRELTDESRARNDELRDLLIKADLQRSFSFEDAVEWCHHAVEAQAAFLNTNYDEEQLEECVHEAYNVMGMSEAEPIRHSATLFSLEGYLIARFFGNSED